jgi:hypothetical protein
MVLKEHNFFMKNYSAIAVLLATTLVATAWANNAQNTSPMPGNVLSGIVLEVKDVDSYTYLRLKTKEGETWAAVGKAQIKKGSTVSIENTMVMTNFESKSLKKTFPTIIFGTLPVSEKETASAHAGVAKVQDSTPIKVSRATGANARTVAEIVSQGKDLKDKPVELHAQVVKFSPAIMGKNWVHLRDGSGSAADGSNDILVTSAGKTKVGDVVTVTGVVRVDKDFGAGYVYKVLIEDGNIQP